MQVQNQVILTLTSEEIKNAIAHYVKLISPEHDVVENLDLIEVIDEKGSLYKFYAQIVIDEKGGHTETA